jgi:transcription initiation factor TFIIB
MSSKHYPHFYFQLMMMMDTSETIVHITSQQSKTKKVKKQLNQKEKEKLWAIYDEDKNCNPKNTLDTIEQTDFCVKCHNLVIYSEEGFPTCPNGQCGFMNQYSLDYSPEWRYFAGEGKTNCPDTTRCGNPIDPLLEESSYACKIFCHPSASIEMKNLRRWSKWQSMPHKEKMLHEEFQLISTYASNAGIPKLFIDHAKSIYKDLYEQKTFRGMKRDAIRAACIWISCWRNGCPRTPNEIAEIFHIDKNSASLGCSSAEELLKSHERTMDEKDKLHFCALTPSTFIERFSSKLEMTKEQHLLAKFIALQVEKKQLIPDNRPQAIAAGILYFISVRCNLSYTKQDIKSKLGDEASEVTINKCFKKLNEYQSELLPSWVLNTYKN